MLYKRRKGSRLTISRNSFHDIGANRPPVERNMLLERQRESRDISMVGGRERYGLDLQMANRCSRAREYARGRFSCEYRPSSRLLSNSLSPPAITSALTPAQFRRVASCSETRIFYDTHSCM